MQEEARAPNLFIVDIGCPLVTEVRREAQAHFKRGRRIILIGHSGHSEVLGTMGQLPPCAVALIGSIEEAEALEPDGRDIAYVTQTSPSVDDTRHIVSALRRRFPSMHAPPVEGIYPTTNWQDAVKAAVRDVEAVIVVGADNSSNAHGSAKSPSVKAGPRSLSPSRMQSIGRRSKAVGRSPSRPARPPRSDRPRYRSAPRALCSCGRDLGDGDIIHGLSAASRLAAGDASNAQ